MQVGCEGLGDAYVQALDDGYGFLAVWVVLVGLDAVGNDRIRGEVLWRDGLAGERSF